MKNRHIYAFIIGTSTLCAQQSDEVERKDTKRKDNTRMCVCESSRQGRSLQQHAQTKFMSIIVANIFSIEAFIKLKLLRLSCMAARMCSLWRVSISLTLRYIVSTVLNRLSSAAAYGSHTLQIRRS